MIILLTAENDEGWLAYIGRGHYVTVNARTREEARIMLLKKLEKLGLPPPAPKAFQPPGPADLLPSHDRFSEGETDDDV
jgi:hypothetical protein